MSDSYIYKFEFRLPSSMSKNGIRVYGDLFRSLADVIHAFEPGDRIQASTSSPGFQWEITKDTEVRTTIKQREA